MSTRDPQLERSYPHSTEAERTIVGIIQIDNSLIAEAIDIVEPADFYVPAYRHVFEAQISLFSQGKEIKPALIEQELVKSGNLSSVGDVNFISSLMDGLPALLTVESHAKLVKDKSMLRQLGKAANKILAEVIAEEEEADIIRDHASKAIFDVTVKHASKTFSDLSTIVDNSIEKAHQIQQHHSAITGLPTGFADVDSLLTGLQPSDLIIIAGRPSMGKTSFGLAIAQHVAIREGKCVAFFSLEMSEEQIAFRVICSEARIDSQAYRTGYIQPEEWDRINEVQAEVAQARMKVDDTPAITVMQLRAKSMRLATELAAAGLELAIIIVDYIQLMSGAPGKKFESRQQEVTQISKDLKGLARELGLPLVALSQLSREPEKRTNHRPVLADLRESGAIEQDADVVAFIYRGDQYKAKEEPKDNIAEIIVAKQRNGPTDTRYLHFNNMFARFDDLYQQQG